MAVVSPLRRYGDNMEVVSALRRYAPSMVDVSDMFTFSAMFAFRESFSLSREAREVMTSESTTTLPDVVIVLKFVP
jgi:hypothetical protein